MASRDGFVNYPLSIPEELRALVEIYQKRMKITSFNQALRVLVETHPGIDTLANELYAGLNIPETGEAPSA